MRGVIFNLLDKGDGLGGFPGFRIPVFTTCGHRWYDKDTIQIL